MAIQYWHADDRNFLLGVIKGIEYVNDSALAIVELKSTSDSLYPYLLLIDDQETDEEERRYYCDGQLHRVD